MPRGTQARMIRAATFSAEIGHPLNTHTTINASHLQRIGEGGVFGVGHLWDGFQCLVELMRHWTTRRGLPWVMIAAREHNGAKARQQGEHWHIAHHLPAALAQDWACQLDVWTGESRDGSRLTSRHNAWHITQRLPGGAGPEDLAAYLGKSEPGWIKLYGKRRENRDKPRRDKFGGEGPVEGKRFRISRAIDSAAQARHGFTGTPREQRHDNRPMRPLSAPSQPSQAFSA